MEPPVFLGSAALVLAFCLFGAVFTERADAFFAGLQSTVVSTFSWYYALVVSVVLVFALWLLFSRFREVRLGPPDSEPEFGYLSWFAMLFSAGIGTGIVFWGVAEPLFHYAEPPLADAQTPEAVREAMQYAFFHWGLHP